MKNEIKKRGRPVSDDPTSSYTVTLKVSEKVELVEKYETLTKAIKTLIIKKT